MKKLLLLTVLFLAFSSAVCYAQDKKVAVVTFYIVKQIDVTDFGGEAQLASIKLRDEPNFNLTPLLQEFHSRFFDEYSKAFPFQLLPEDEVVNNDAYKAFTPRVSEVTSGPLKGMSPEMFSQPYAGYKVIIPLAGKAHVDEHNLAAIFPQADGIMKVYVDFSLIKIGFGGMGVVRVNARSYIDLFDKNGEKVFRLFQDAKSKISSPLIANVPVMTPEKILPMCESAMDELMADLKDDMPKLIKKANAKL